MDNESPIVLKRQDVHRWTLRVADLGEVTVTTEVVRSEFKAHRTAIRMTPVESSQIEEVGYDPDSWNLAVRFKGGATYLYLDVEPDVAAPMLAAPEPGWSLGRYFSTNVKPHPDRYPYRRLA